MNVTLRENLLAVHKDYLPRPHLAAERRHSLRQWTIAECTTFVVWRRWRIWFAIRDAVWTGAHSKRGCTPACVPACTRSFLLAFGIVAHGSKGLIEIGVRLLQAGEEGFATFQASNQIERRL